MLTPASVLPISSRLSSPLDINAVSKLSHVWRAGELNTAPQPALSTGYQALNRELPGGGWPQGAMVEVLQPQAGQHEWGLLAPVLAALQGGDSATGRAHKLPTLLVLTGAPYWPFGPSLCARQLTMPQLLSVHAQPEPGQAPALLWATREALQCADVAAVLAWLPDARSAHLRRLQIAAHTHNKLLFVFRPLRAQHESSPAPLRLLLQGSAEGAGNLLVHVLRRRGPPLVDPVVLDTRPERLTALLAASRERVRRRDALTPLMPLMPLTPLTPLAPLAPQVNPAMTAVSDLLRKASYALDRTSSAAHH